MNLDQHELSAAFPAMQFAEYESLLESIKAIGLQNPIVLFEGRIIDGWHRYCACRDSGTAIRTIELASGTDPQSFVIAQNKERRHLTQSQLAIAAVTVYEWRKRGTDNLPKTALSAGLAEANKNNDLQSIKTSAEIAKSAGVAKKTIEEAKQVLTNATPEIKEKVTSGDLSVSTAVKQMAKAKAEAPPIDDYAPSFEELAEAEAERLAKEKLIDNLMVSDEAFADLAKKFIQVEAMNLVLESRNNGLMNENAALSRLIKSRDREIEKLRRAGK